MEMTEDIIWNILDISDWLLDHVDYIDWLSFNDNFYTEDSYIIVLYWIDRIQYILKHFYYYLERNNRYPKNCIFPCIILKEKFFISYFN